MTVAQLKMTRCQSYALCAERAKCAYFARKVSTNSLILLAQSSFAQSAEITPRKVRIVKPNQVLTARNVTLREIPPFGRVLRCAAQPPPRSKGAGKLIETCRAPGLTSCQAGRFRTASLPPSGLDDPSRPRALTAGCIFDTSMSRFSRGRSAA